MTDSNELNPYAPPKSPAAPAAPQTLREPRVEGDCIVVTSGISLPLRCVKTNAACDLTQKRSRKLSYAPSFRFVTSRRTCRVQCCLSKPLRKRQVIIWLVAYLLAFALLYFLCGMAIVAGLFATIAITALPPDRLKIVKYKYGEFWIRGLNKDFLQALVAEDGWKQA